MTENRKKIIVTAAIVGSRPQWLNMADVTIPVEPATLKEHKKKYKDFLELGWKLELHNAEGKEPTAEDDMCRGNIYFPQGKKGTLDSYYAPVKPSQIIASAKASHKAGASIVHFHTREVVPDGEMVIPEDDAGQWKAIERLKYLNTIDPKQYAEIIEKLRKECPELLLNFSTSARAMDFGKQGEQSFRKAHLASSEIGVRPQIASCSLCDVWFADSGYANTPEFVDDQLKFFQANNIRPEIEIFGTNFVDAAIEKRVQIELCGKPAMFTLVLGPTMYRNGTADKTDDNEIVSLLPPELVAAQIPDSEKVERIVEHLKPTIKRLRKEFGENCVISALGAGKLQSLLVGIATGLNLDGIRVGLEDAPKVLGEDGKAKYATGPDQVEWVVGKIKEAGMEVASHEEARKTLGLDLMQNRTITR